MCKVHNVGLRYIKVILTQKLLLSSRNMIRDVLFIPDPDLEFLPIPDPGSGGQKGTGSWITDPGSGSATLFSFYMVYRYIITRILF